MHDKNVTVLKSIPLCADDARFTGRVEVVRISSDRKPTTIGMRLFVGEHNHYVIVPRHRTAEIISALEQASKEASAAYLQLIKDMNP
jgi:transcriptional regulator of heat shock response